jgi:hypothetical protein
MSVENELKALRTEAAGYIRVGLIDKVAAVNAEIMARGGEPVALPEGDEVKVRKAVSPGAATRRKTSSRKAKR